MTKFTASECDVVADYLRDGQMPSVIADRLARIHDLDEGETQNVAALAGAIYRNEFWKSYLKEGEEWTRPADIPVAP